MRRLVLLPLLALLISCAAINPDADKFVVRVEQTQSVANATFDFILRTDHADRAFWRTNAPAFHNFCEWLRTPQLYGTGTVSRVQAIQLNVHDLKVVYKKSKTPSNSNLLYSAWSVLSAAVTQSVSWSNIVVAPVHP